MITFLPCWYELLGQNMLSKLKQNLFSFFPFPRLFSSIREHMWNEPKPTQSGLWDSPPHSLSQVLRLLWMIMSKVVPKSQVHDIKLVILSATFDDYSELSNRQWNIITFHEACWLFLFKIISMYLYINLNLILLCICCNGMEVSLTALLFFRIVYKKDITFHSSNTKIC